MNWLAEYEAKMKLCPFLRKHGDLGDYTRPMHVPIGTCVASDCMMWVEDPGNNRYGVCGLRDRVPA